MQRRQFAAAAPLALAAAQQPGLRAALFTQRGGPHLSAYLPALAATPEITAVSVCDPSGDCFEDARRILGSRLSSVHRDASALLRAEKPGMALVAMEAKLAPPVIAAALDAGAHVLAEKPACLRAEDFAALVAKAKSQGRQLVLAFANRIDPVVLHARTLIGEGHFGRILGQELHLVADQTRLTRAAYHDTWYAKKDRAGGGHLIWLGIHWLDLAMYLTGSRIRAVAAFTANAGGQPIDVEDSAVVSLRFDNGTLGTLTSGYYLDRGYHSMIKIWGTKGWIEMRRHTGPVLEWSTGGRVHRIEQNEGASGYTAFVQRMTRAFMGLEAAPLDANDSLAALEVVFAAYRSAGTGRTVELA